MSGGRLFNVSCRLRTTATVLFEADGGVMRKCSVFLAGVALAAIGGCSPQMEPPSSQDEALSGAGFAAVAGEVGGWDLTGPIVI